MSSRMSEMSGQNPFTLSFGRKPEQYIARLVQTEEIVQDFLQDRPASQVYMITGVRGSGKTVLMTGIAQEFEKKPDWITVELNPNLDLQKGLAASLYSQPGMAVFFAQAKIDLSFLGIGISIEKGDAIYDYDTALARMMEVIKRMGRRVLICIDEVSDTEQMRVFASTFQILIRKEYPVHLLVTGLYENIYDLQNEKNLTFLYRAPKIRLEPLNFTAIRAVYQKALEIPAEKAGKMASLVRGYPYAFQLLGYLCWQNPGSSLDDLMPLFDQYLEEYVYSKIWSELSGKDRAVLLALAETDDGLVGKIRECVGMKSNDFSVYRERLIRKGVVISPERGRLTFSLPRFGEFVTSRMFAE